jgi:predicted RNA-binding Zn ribbon-like protein
MSAGHPTHALGRVLPEASWPPGREAPDPLERVRRFINSTNLESGADRLTSPAQARAWLDAEGHRLPARISVTDVERLRRLRELLRDLISPGDAVDTARVRRDLDRFAAGVRFRLRADPALCLDPIGTGVDGLIGRLLITAHDAAVAGTWRRLKSCRNPHCRWAYFDHSKNASGNWCSTTACGARDKARAYRHRQKEARS